MKRTPGTRNSSPQSDSGETVWARCGFMTLERQQMPTFGSGPSAASRAAQAALRAGSGLSQPSGRSGKLATVGLR